MSIEKEERASSYALFTCEKSIKSAPKIGVAGFDNISCQQDKHNLSLCQTNLMI